MGKAGCNLVVFSVSCGFSCSLHSSQGEGRGAAVKGALGDGSTWRLPLLWGWDSAQPVPEDLVGCGGNDKAVWYLSGGHWLPLSILQH